MGVPVRAIETMMLPDEAKSAAFLALPPVFFPRVIFINIKLSLCLVHNRLVVFPCIPTRGQPLGFGPRDPQSPLSLGQRTRGLGLRTKGKCLTYNSPSTLSLSPRHLHTTDL